MKGRACMIDCLPKLGLEKILQIGNQRLFIRTSVFEYMFYSTTIYTQQSSSDREF